MTGRATGGPAVAVVVAALVAVLAAACGVGPAGPTSPTSPASPTSPTSPANGASPTRTPGPISSTAPASEDDVRARVLRDGTPLTSGRVTLVVLPVAPGGGTVATQPDGSARWQPAPGTAPASPSSDGTGTDGTSATLLVAAPDPLTLDLLLDGTVVVRAEGAPVAGLSPTGSGRLAREGDVLELRGGPGAGAWLATRMVEDLAWGDREGGRSLAVTPSAWARTGGLAADELVPDQVVAAEPEAGSATMLAQLACHQLGAPDKATWNLEPWRPDVGPVDMIVARCNPTA